jgi:undecaprenyl-diphosphatase
MFLDDLGVLHFTPFAGDWRFAGFPSGHATTAFALAYAIFHLFGRWGLLAFFGAALIALSRIVDGVHYFSDVVAGVALGSLGAILIHRFFVDKGWIYKKDAPHENRMLAPIKWSMRKR